MAKPRLSRPMNIGGRGCSFVEGLVSSVQRSWKTGHANSGSSALRLERRSREILGWRGIGNDSGGGLDKVMLKRVGLARAILESRLDR